VGVLGSGNNLLNTGIGNLEAGSKINSSLGATISSVELVCPEREERRLIKNTAEVVSVIIENIVLDGRSSETRRSETVRGSGSSGVGILSDIHVKRRTAVVASAEASRVNLVAVIPLVVCDEEALTSTNDPGESRAISAKTSTTAGDLANVRVSGSVAVEGRARTEPDVGHVLVLGNLGLATVTGVEIAVSVVLGTDILAVTTLSGKGDSINGDARVSKRTKVRGGDRGVAVCGGGAEVTDTTVEETIDVSGGVALCILVTLGVGSASTAGVDTRRSGAIERPTEIVGKEISAGLKSVYGGILLEDNLEVVLSKAVIGVDGSPGRGSLRHNASKGFAGNGGSVELEGTEGVTVVLGNLATGLPVAIDIEAEILIASPTNVALVMGSITAGAVALIKNAANKDASLGVETSNTRASSIKGSVTEEGGSGVLELTVVLVPERVSNLSGDGSSLNSVCVARFPELGLVAVDDVLVDASRGRGVDETRKDGAIVETLVGAVVTSALMVVDVGLTTVTGFAITVSVTVKGIADHVTDTELGGLVETCRETVVGRGRRGRLEGGEASSGNSNGTTVTPSLGNTGDTVLAHISVHVPSPLGISSSVTASEARSSSGNSLASLIVLVVVELVETNKVTRIVVVHGITVNPAVTTDVIVTLASVDKERGISNEAVRLNEVKPLEVVASRARVCTSELREESPRILGRRALSTLGGGLDNGTGSDLNRGEDIGGALLVAVSGTRSPVRPGRELAISLEHLELVGALNALVESRAHLDLVELVLNEVAFLTLTSSSGVLKRRVDLLVEERNDVATVASGSADVSETGLDSDIAEELDTIPVGVIVVAKHAVVTSGETGGGGLDGVSSESTVDGSGGGDGLDIRISGVSRTTAINETTTGVRASAHRPGGPVGHNSLGVRLGPWDVTVRSNLTTVLPLTVEIVATSGASTLALKISRLGRVRDARDGASGVGESETVSARLTATARDVDGNAIVVSNVGIGRLTADSEAFLAGAVASTVGEAPLVGVLKVVVSSRDMVATEGKVGVGPGGREEWILEGVEAVTERVHVRKTIDPAATKRVESLTSGSVSQIIVGVEVDSTSAVGGLRLATITRITVAINPSILTIVEAVTGPAELVILAGRDGLVENLLHGVVRAIGGGPVATVTLRLGGDSRAIDVLGVLSAVTAEARALEVKAVELSARLGVATPVLLEELTSPGFDSLGRKTGLGDTERIAVELTTEAAKITSEVTGLGEDLTGTDTDTTSVVSVARGRAGAPLGPLGDLAENSWGTVTGAVKLTRHGTATETEIGNDVRSGDGLAVGGGTGSPKLWALVTDTRTDEVSPVERADGGRVTLVEGGGSSGDTDTETITKTFVIRHELEPILNERKMALTTVGGGG